MTGEVTILPPQERTHDGRFRPGVRPRTAWTKDTAPPGGTRPSLYLECRQLSRDYSTRAIERLTEIAESRDERVAAVACQILLDRAWGKPKETAPIEESARPDLSNLSDKDLVTLRKLLAKMATRKAEPTEAPASDKTG